MRNARFHQGKNERQWKKEKVNRNTCIQHFLIKGVTRIEFVKFHVQKSVLHLQIFLLIKPIVVVVFF